MNYMDINIVSYIPFSQMEYLASLYNCKIIAYHPDYVTIEGEQMDLDEFAKFWAQETMR